LTIRLTIAERRRRRPQTPARRAFRTAIDAHAARRVDKNRPDLRKSRADTQALWHYACHAPNRTPKRVRNGRAALPRSRRFRFGDNAPIAVLLIKF